MRLVKGGDTPADDEILLKKVFLGKKCMVYIAHFLGAKSFFSKNCHFLEKKNLYIFFIFLQCFDEIIAIHFYQGFSAIFTICLLEILFMERSWLRLLAYGKVVMIGKVPCRDCLNLPRERPFTQIHLPVHQVQPNTPQYTCHLRTQCHKQHRDRVRQKDRNSSNRCGDAY